MKLSLCCLMTVLSMSCAKPGLPGFAWGQIVKEMNKEMQKEPAHSNCNILRFPTNPKPIVLRVPEDWRLAAIKEIQELMAAESANSKELLDMGLRPMPELVII